MIISHKNIISPVYALSGLRIMKWNKHQQMKKKKYQEVCKESQTFKNSCRVTWTCFFGASVACHMSISSGHWEEFLYGISTSELWHARAKKNLMKFRWPDKLAWYYFIRRSNWQSPTVKYYLVPHFCSPVLNSRLFLIVWAHNDINGHQNHFRRFTD